MTCEGTSLLDPEEEDSAREIQRVRRILLPDTIRWSHGEDDEFPGDDGQE